MNKFLNHDKTFQFIKKLFIIAIISWLIVLASYFYQFHSGFSLQQQDWGIFGDYVGGTLNPILSFLTLLALLYTLILQSSELHNARKQSQKDDLLKIIMIYSEVIDNSSKRAVCFQVLDRSGGFITEKEMIINVFGPLKKQEHFEMFPDGHAKEEMEDSLRYIIASLTTFYNYLREYKKLAEDDIISSFYGSKYEELCMNLSKKGYLGQEAFKL